MSGRATEELAALSSTEAALSSTEAALRPKELAETHLQIGVVMRPHGVRGELKVRLHNEDSSALWSAERITLSFPRGRGGSQSTEVREVESVRGSAKGPILALAGVDSRELADALRSAELWVERSLLAPLDEGEYYLVDLIGCGLVFDEQVIAKVIDVRPDPSVDTMILRMKDGRAAELPIVDAWVGEVDVAQKKVHLLSRDGLIFD